MYQFSLSFSCDVKLLYNKLFWLIKVSFSPQITKSHLQLLEYQLVLIFSEHQISLRINTYAACTNTIPISALKRSYEIISKRVKFSQLNDYQQWVQSWDIIRLFIWSVPHIDHRASVAATSTAVFFNPVTRWSSCGEKQVF